MTEGTVPVPPYHPVAYRDDEVLPIRGLSYLGEHKVEGMRSPYAIILPLSISSEENIIQIQGLFRSISYDTCRRPKTGCPRGGLVNKN